MESFTASTACFGSAAPNPSAANRASELVADTTDSPKRALGRVESCLACPQMYTITAVSWADRLLSTKTTANEYGRALAKFSADERDFPASVRHAAVRALLDSVGVAVGGAREPAARIVQNSVRRSGTSTVIAAGRIASPENAALVNGVMAHVLDFDDTIMPTRLHPSAALVPALLAASEEVDASGRDLLDAFIVGFEVQARLADATYPAFAERNWHGTGVFGGVGAAAGVARILGLDSERTEEAMAIAATGAGGMMHVFGSMAKSLNLGRAAAIGVQSARLAAQGFSGGRAIINGVESFLHMYADHPRIEAVMTGLGADWRIVDDGFKPYPCGVVGHAAIDAVRQLRSRAAKRMPARIHLEVSEETMRLMGRGDPRNELEAKFSVRYCAAIAWMHGTVTLGSFDSIWLDAPEIGELMRRITIVTEDLPQDAANCEITYEGDEVDREEVAHARGTAAQPMTDAELAAKFVAVAARHPDVDRLLSTLQHIEAVPVRTITELLAMPLREADSHSAQ
jgi:2-methylcitrate dehydratase PrpD